MDTYPQLGRKKTFLPGWQNAFGSSTIFPDPFIRRKPGKLFELLLQVVVIGVAKLLGYGRPCSVGMCDLKLVCLVEAGHAAEKLGADPDTLHEFPVKLLGAEASLPGNSI